jgi:hypothetical protein
VLTFDAGIKMRRLSILTAAAALGLMLGGTAVTAQQTVDRTFAFQPGDVVRFHSKGGSYPDITAQILSCHDLGNASKYGCLVREHSPRAGREADMWLDIYSPEYTEITLLSRGGARPGPPEPKPGLSPNAVRPVVATTSAPTVAGQCPGPIADASTAPAFTAAAARWAIYENYAALARRGSTNGRPVAVGVTFESLALGKSEPNAVLNDPGRGAYLKNSAAPRGTTLYSVASVYRVCERYADSTRIARYQARHVCFKTTKASGAAALTGSRSDRPSNRLMISVCPAISEMSCGRFCPLG